jgi:hypothetical protein
MELKKESYFTSIEKLRESKEKVNKELKEKESETSEDVDVELEVW